MTLIDIFSVLSLRISFMSLVLLRDCFAVLDSSQVENEHDTFSHLSIIKFALMYSDYRETG